MAVINGTTYHDDTPARVIEVLERARALRERVRVHYGDVNTGRDWEDVYDVTGYVGRSIGPNRVPLLLHNRKSIGGGSILDNCIVRVRYANKKNGGDLYRHKDYHCGSQ